MLGLFDFQIFKMTKGAIAKEKRKNKSVADEKRTRTASQTRVGMNFDPKSSILTSQDEVSNYLMRYRGCLLSLIKAEFVSLQQT